jgi:hypothetical protein
VPGATDATVAYGILPLALLATIRERFLAIVNAGTARRAAESGRFIPNSHERPICELIV